MGVRERLPGPRAFADTAPAEEKKALSGWLEQTTARSACTHGVMITGNMTAWLRNRSHETDCADAEHDQPLPFTPQAREPARPFE